MPTRQSLLDSADQLIRSVKDDTPKDEVHAIERRHQTALTDIRILDEAREMGVEGLDAMTMRQVKEAWIEASAEKGDRTYINGQARVFGNDPAADAAWNARRGATSATRAERMAEALYARIDSRHNLSAEAQEFAGMTILDLARQSLGRQQMFTSSPAATITRALHGSSDFSQALGGLVNRVVRNGYQQVPQALHRVARRTTAPDFRSKRLISLSGFSALEKINEHGEYKRGTFTEGAETYRIETWGKVFAISRQALINDDLNVFDVIPRRLGLQAAVFEASTLAALVESGPGSNGPAMSDGKPLFHADHKNLGTAAALSEASLSAARLAMRKQTGLASELIDITPKFLIVPAELETAAERLLSDIQATKSADANPFAGRLDLIVEPRFTDPTAWYVAADPAQVDGLEYAYLEGEPGPVIDQKTGFDVDATELKIRLDFGAGFVEHRSWYKNPGAPAA